MNLELITKAISNLTFPEYKTDEVKSIIMLPDNYIVQDPLKVLPKVQSQKRREPRREYNSNFFDKFLQTFFERFNKDIPKDKFLLEFKDFKKVFLNELRAGALRNWKYSSFRKNKDKVIESIEKEQLSYYLLQWIADFYNILVILKNKEYIPRRSKDDKPVLKIL